MKGPIFLARRTYRMRRKRDLARMLPLAGAFLMVLPMLWGDVDSDSRRTSSDGLYLFVVWFGLILAAAILSRGLREEPSSDPEDKS
ncbi:MAG: hypothetical protein ACJASV_002254 [Pseudorhodobacter sp.]|jgi:hypothetical protein